MVITKRINIYVVYYELQDTIEFFFSPKNVFIQKFTIDILEIKLIIVFVHPSLSSTFTLLIKITNKIR